MIDLERSEQTLRPDPRRLVARPFLPGAAAFGGDSRRLELIVDRILDLAPEVQSRLLADTLNRSAGRHRDIRSTWIQHFGMACERAPRLDNVTDPDVRLLIGACLTLAYAYEGAALTNPSIVPLGEASGGMQPFVMSA
ncbi:MAG: glycosidase, partial [Acidimicrobiia bacterium]